MKKGIGTIGALLVAVLALGILLYLFGQTGRAATGLVPYKEIESADTILIKSSGAQIFKARLVENTYSGCIECHAIMELTSAYSFKGTDFPKGFEFSFETLKGTGLQDWQLSVWQETTTAEPVWTWATVARTCPTELDCKNATLAKECDAIPGDFDKDGKKIQFNNCDYEEKVWKNQLVTRQGWAGIASVKEFVFEAGKPYKVMLSGTKAPLKATMKSSVDWKPTIYGLELKEWAAWNTSAWAYVDLQLNSTKEVNEMPYWYDFDLPAGYTGNLSKELKLTKCQQAACSSWVEMTPANSAFAIIRMNNTTAGACTYNEWNNCLNPTHAWIMFFGNLTLGNTNSTYCKANETGCYQLWLINASLGAVSPDWVGNNMITATFSGALWQINTGNTKSELGSPYGMTGQVESWSKFNTVDWAGVGDSIFGSWGDGVPSSTPGANRTRFLALNITATLAGKGWCLFYYYVGKDYWDQRCEGLPATGTEAIVPRWRYKPEGAIGATTIIGVYLNKTNVTRAAGLQISENTTGGFYAFWDKNYQDYSYAFWSNKTYLNRRNVYSDGDGFYACIGGSGNDCGTRLAPLSTWGGKVNLRFGFANRTNATSEGYMDPVLQAWLQYDEYENMSVIGPVGTWQSTAGSFTPVTFVDLETPDGTYPGSTTIQHFFYPIASYALNNATLYVWFTTNGTLYRSQANTSSIGNNSQQVITLTGMTPNANFTFNVLVYQGGNTTAWNTTNNTYFRTSSEIVLLTSPATGNATNISNVPFKFTPQFTNALNNATLYIWTQLNGNSYLIQGNVSTVTNGTENTISGIIGADGVYIWNVQVCSEAGLKCAFNATNKTIQRNQGLPTFATVTGNPSNHEDGTSVFSSVITEYNISMAFCDISNSTGSFNKTATNSSGNWTCSYTTGTFSPAHATYYIKFFANDSGFNWGGSDNQSFTVPNQLPTVPSLSDVQPNPAYKDSNLSSNPSGSTDADSTDTLSYYQKINTSAGATIRDWAIADYWFNCSLFANCNKTLDMRFWAIATDGYGNSSPSALKARTISNTAPVLNTPPAVNSTAPVLDQTINCGSGAFYDLDSDSETDGWLWWNQSIQVSGGTNQPLYLDAALYQVGNVLICSQRVSDGTAWSFWSNSSNSATISATTSVSTSTTSTTIPTTSTSINGTFYYPLPDVSSFTDYFSYVNSVTNQLGVTLLWLAFWLALFFGVKEKMRIEAAIPLSSFAAAIVGHILSTAGLMSNTLVLIAILAAATGVFL